MPQATEEEAAQNRPSATPSPRRVPLGTRLAVFVALSVATVIIVLTFAGARIAQGQLDGDLRETARVTAVALADDIELRQEPWDTEALVPVLRDFMNAGADLRSISVFRADRTAAVPVISTSVVDAAPEAVVQQAIATGGSRHGPKRCPTRRSSPCRSARATDVTGGAVAVAVSLTTVEQLRRTAGLIAVGGAIFGMAGITLLIHLLARRLILEPLTEIRRVIARARHGDLASRATLNSNNELKEVADGLNAMLSELDSLNKSLSQRVAAATSELRDRNAQLVRSYESVLQLRETAARAQQLAAVGQTMANVAHQIGTPLNLVSGHVQLLQQELVDPALQRRLNIVQEQIERVASTVRDLLERARPRTDRRAVSVGTILGHDRRRDALRLGRDRRDPRSKRSADLSGGRRRRDATRARAAQSRDQRHRRDARRRHVDGGRRRQTRTASASRCATPEQASRLTSSRRCSIPG